MDDFRLDFSVRVYGEEATGDGQLEAARATGAGIKADGLEVVEHVSVAILDADAVSERLPVE